MNPMTRFTRSWSNVKINYVEVKVSRNQFLIKLNFGITT